MVASWFVTMDLFAHALPFLNDPYFDVGCCIPDWLSACDLEIPGTLS